MSFYVSLILICALPISLIVYFVVSLVMYCSANIENKKNPGNISEEVLKSRKIRLVRSAVIVGILLAIIAVIAVAVVVLIASAVSYM